MLGRWLRVGLLSIVGLSPATAQSDPKPAGEKPKAAVDLYGDPLPPGAVARAPAQKKSDQPPSTPSATGTPRLHWAVNAAGIVGRLAFSPDGRTLASSSGRDDVIRLWETASGKERATLPDAVSIAFRPDGRMLASGKADGTVKISDLVSGKTIATLEGHRSLVRSVAFSPDGKTLASSDWGSAIRLWDVAKAIKGEQTEATHRLAGHRASVNSLAFSPDGGTLASAISDKTVKLWDVASGRNTATLEGHHSEVLCLAFSPQGGRLVSSCQGQIKLWDARGKIVDTFEIRSENPQDSKPYVAGMAFLPGGRELALGCGFFTEGNTRFNQGRIIIWDMMNRKQLSRTIVASEPNGVVSCLAFTRHGNLLAAGGHDQVIRLWEIPANEKNAGR